MILAWHVAAFERHKKLPDLQALLKKVATGASPAGPKTLAQHRSELALLSDFLGQPLRKAKKGSRTKK